MNAEPPAPEEAPVAVNGSRHGVMRLALWTGGLVLGVASLYLATMAFLWHSHVGDLSSTKRDLSGQLADKETALEETSADLEAVRSGLEETLENLRGLANEKAQAQDFQLLLEDVAIALADCASESDILLGYVYDRASYYPGPLWDYEDAVREYCGSLSQALTELATEAEEALS